MADQRAPQMQPTLGLTGLTSNAMALIAPGAFLWLTFFIQATEGATAPSMWWGIVAALLLCLATAVAYAEISKLDPEPDRVTTTPNRPCYPRTRHSSMLASPSLSWAGVRTCTTGYIQE